MTKGSFQIDCISCNKPVLFSLKDIEATSVVNCSECGKGYAFTDAKLQRQLAKFAALCSQIQESEEILGNSSVAVEVGQHKVQVPFKILLTRLKSTLDLKVGDQRMSVIFRTEPITANDKEA